MSLDFRAAAANSLGGFIVGIHGHTATDENHVGARLLGIFDMVGDHVWIVW